MTALLTDAHLAAADVTAVPAVTAVHPAPGVAGVSGVEEPPGLRAAQEALLADLDLLEARDDAELDTVVRLAASVTGYPVAMLNALGAEQVRQLARAGTGPRPMERGESLCHRAALVGAGAVVVSGDCSTDPRFADLPWVDGRLGRVRRYAAAPVRVDDTVVATLCLMDAAPGPALDGQGQAHLADLAALATELLERRRRARLADAARAELAQAHEELVRTRAFDRALLAVVPVGVVAADADGRVALANDVARDWLDDGGHGAYAATDAGDGGDGAGDGDDRPAVEALVAELGLLDGDGEVVVASRSGQARTVAFRGAPVTDALGRVLGAVSALADVTELRAHEDRARLATHVDGLTGLPTRVLLVDRLDAALAAGATSGDALAVLHCDLDGFKAVNAAQGHAFGDAVLVETAARLTAAVSTGDVVAHLGGDEFVVVCPQVSSARVAEAVARRIADAVAAPIAIAGVQLRVGVSTGTALSAPGASAEQLLHAAEAAMSAAKQRRQVVTSA